MRKILLILGVCVCSFFACQKDIELMHHKTSPNIEKEEPEVEKEEPEVIDTSENNSSLSDGVIKAEFSVSATKQVYFSKGNLQYQASTNTWRFAEHQYDMIGSDNSNISSSYSGWIDLFGWGTSGWNSGANAYQPYSVSMDYWDYYPSGLETYNIVGKCANSDWGIYNAISNGGNQAGLWRTLTKNEWSYLINLRPNASLKKGFATVNGVKGLIILPDNWIMPTELNFQCGTQYYENNNYSAEQWAELESNGAIFLPLSGSRMGTSVSWVGNGGGYWSSTCVDETSSYYMYYHNNSSSISTDGRYYGQSVRLVRDTEGIKIDISSDVPFVSTDSIFDVTDTSANVSGEIISSIGSELLEYGICWGTNTSPTIKNQKKSGFEEFNRNFNVTLTELTEGSKYYVRAYATNSVGTSYGNILSFTTKEKSANIIDGAIQAAFSISASKQVYFSQGNLQYQASTGTWRFAEHQYDMIGSDNSNISSWYSGWIDLFGWGTSGWYSGANAYRPYSTSTSYSDYYPGGSSSNNLTGSYANADWGVYNKISNGGNAAGMWRTLTSSEWKYVISNRADASYLRGTATVNGVHGLILLPDTWTLPTGLTFTYGAGGWSQNTYTASEWSKMEANGAVFLPAAGYRGGTDVYGVGSYGYYWSSSAYGDGSAYYPYFNGGGGVYTYSYGYRYYGRSVRLVRGL